MNVNEYLENYKKNRKKELEEKQRTGGLTADEFMELNGIGTQTQNDRTWFSKGSFEDGYQVGDITKTVLGTAGDVASNVGAGVLGIGEKTVDAGAYLVGGIGGMFGADKFKNNVQDFIKKDLYDEEKLSKAILFGGYGDTLDIDKYSVLGEKSDSLAQSGGQLLGTIGLQAVGVPWWVTTGVTSFGGEVESAFNEGATYGKAGLSGLVTAGADILTEKMFGGSGLGEKGLINLDLLTKGISNKVVKTLVDFGIDRLAEGSEEVVAGVISNLGSALYKEGNAWDIITSEEAIDEYIESFIGGLALSGFSNVGQLGSSIKNKTDFRTGVTANEQTIIDNAVEKRIKEAEKKGEKLSKKEKTEIEQEVLNSLKRGEIDLDTISSTFGGDSYTAYESLKKESDEFNTLYKTKKGDLSREQEVRLEELETKNKEKSYSDRLLEAQQKLETDVKTATQNDIYLQESFAEEGRKSEVFKLSEEEKKTFTAEEMKIVNKAIESGEINNTRKAHDMVSFVAKLSADLKTDFDFTNNKKLAEAGYTVEGKTIDGFKEGNKIAVNLQSKKALNTVVGHEITHVLEGTDLYTALQSTLKEYATSKGVYQSLFDTAKENYKNVYKGLTEAEYNKKIEQEVTADLVGDYIFSDMDFVRNLSTKNPNVFQKVFNEIKHMLKLVTAGSDAEKQLLKAKKIFEDVYRDTKRNTSEETQFSITESFQDTDGNHYDSAVLLDTEVFNKESPRNWGSVLRNEVEKRSQEKPFIMPVIDENGDIQQLQFASTKDRVKKDDGREHKVLNKLSSTNDNISKLAVIHIDEIVEVSEEGQPYHTDENTHKWLDKNGWLHRTAYVINAKNGAIYQITMDIAKAEDGRTILYAVNGKTKRVGSVKVNSLKLRGSRQDSNSTDSSLSENDKKSTEKSQQDNKGRTLSEATQNFLVDSKIRDENGNIKTMYHGSPAQFTVFDKKKAKSSGYYGKGFYFSDSESHAGQYGSKYEVYLNIKNPLQGETHDITKEQLRKFVDAVAENEDYGIENYGYDATVDSVVDSVYGKDDFAMLMDINTTSIGNMVEAIELFNEVNGTNYDGIIAPTETVAFYPEQIKSVTNQNPTDNPDINLSLTDNNKSIAPTPNGIYGKDVMLERSIAPPVQNQSVETNNMIAPQVQAENEAYNELFTPMTEEEAHNMVDSEENWERIQSLQEADETIDIAPPIYSSDTSRLTEADLREVRKSIKDKLPLQRGRTKEFNNIVQRYSTSEFPDIDALFYEIKDKFGKVTVTEEIQDVAEVQNVLKQTRIKVSDSIKNGMADYVDTMRRNAFKLRFSKDGIPVDVAYQELSEMYPNMFPDDIANEIDQFEQILSVANMNRTETGEFEVDDFTIGDMVNSIVTTVRDVRTRHNQNVAERRARWFDKDQTLEEYMQTDDYSELEGNPNLLRVFHERWDRNRIASEPQIDYSVAQILESEPIVQKKGFKENIKRKWAVFKANFIDKGAVFEDLAKTTKNRNLDAKWDYTMLAEAQAQYHMQHGDGNTKSLDAIREEVDNTGHTKEFTEYMYHSLNIDRMTLDARYGIENKAVFGSTVTAEVSKQKVAELESAHPEFKAYAQDVYDYMNNLRQRMVENGIVSQETADLWSEMYPHYVPIRRVDSKGANINVPLATDRTGVNAPIKRATGGSSDILPLFDTLGQRTMQTFKAINKNDFGIELKNTLGSTISRQNQGVEGAIDMVETQDALLQAGKNGYNPTFTVFENGQRVEFEITQEMYEALLPMSDKMRDSGSKILQKASSFHRGVLTEYNPVFALTNAIKDIQDVFMNSQHPLKTYAKVKEATQQLLNKGQWYQEYMRNGGEDNSYFDTETNSIAPTKKGVLDTFPLKQISNLNNFIERVPRLAEYIASREMGRSVQESMLDASRVTTNFKAGGDVTKFLNKNGATFLNASVQGFAQQVRNVRDANMNGLKGWGALATRFAVAGLPALLLNNLLWDDDDEYEELSDYVKQNYYVIGKYGDGQFIRIPKGRTVAVIQEAFNQMDKLATGDDSADFKTFLEVLTNNLAPNNPISNNVAAPLVQAVTNKTWYGGDLVPQRLQDMPNAEQYDESTDSISKAIGKAFNISPMKVNYVLDQYTGLVGDMILPALTPEVTNGSEGALGYAIAPLKDKFTTDGVMNKQVITDLYDKSEELTTNAKKSNATSEDVLKNKYLNSIKAEMNELYKQKRELQNSDLPNKEKYAQVREVQRQISELAKEGMSNYNNVEVYSNYARVNDRHYHLNDNGEWQKVNDKQLAKQNEVTSALGISASDYWNSKEEYDYAYEYPGKYGIAKAVGGYGSYKAYNEALGDIKSDKNIYGESINGSRKTKVLTYINSLDADYYTKIMLFKKEYPSDDTYNMEIINYLNEREDITRQEMIDILTELGFKVSQDGTIRW